MTTPADIKRSLEKTFDIPFVVTIEMVNGEPVYRLAPEDPHKELFMIRVNVRNGVRLNMEFIPQKYSAHFVQNMGTKPEASKALFCQYFTTMNSKGAICHARVNGFNLDFTDITSWPSSWESFEARVTKMPATLDDTLTVPDIVSEWGELMMGAILSLADIVSVEENSPSGYQEGASSTVLVNKYERNPLNRKLCLANMGYSCQICGMSFEDTYGMIGKGFIHVHHIIPVSQIGAGYVINPLKTRIF